jgi:hypothetical protein
MKCWKCQNELTTGDGLGNLCNHCRSVENYQHHATSSADACAGGHVFYTTGTGPVLEGTPCACRQTYAHWHHCCECGQRVFRAEPRSPCYGGGGK